MRQWVCGVLIVCVSGSAFAQSRETKRGALTRASTGSHSIDVARARAKSGDCQAALPLFDEAEQKGAEAALYRDRGACHEKLGHVFPAIDDFRAYLLARPDASDSDDVRARLGALESATMQAAPPTSKEPGRAPTREEAAKAEPLSIREFDTLTLKKAEQDASDASPLRRGTGFSLAPYLGLRSIMGEGSTSDLGYHFGLSLRNSLGKVGSVVLEVGYAGFGDSGAASSAGGLQTMLGLEARFALDTPAANQIFILGGFGYERLKVSSSKIVSNVFFLPRAKLGFRHVFGPSLAFELALDGGPLLQKATNLPLNVSADARFLFALGGTAALAVAF